MSTYEVRSSETVLDGRVLHVRRDAVVMPDGSTSVREVVSHPGAVGVVALDDDGTVVLVEQYRHPVGARLLELPAGLLDVDGEPALETARRELAEETGLTARDWHVLVDVHTSPGGSDEAARVYLARGLAAHPDGRPEGRDEEADLDVVRLPLDEAVARVTDGSLTQSLAVAGLLAAALARGAGWSGLRDASAPWPARPDRAPAG